MPFARTGRACSPARGGGDAVGQARRVHPVAGAALALLAALLFAAAAVAQQSAASALPDARGTALLVALARRPLWWVGTLGDTAGFVAQAVALGLGALVLVQPLLVTTLLFALPLGARWAGRRVRRADLGWAAVLAAALAVFVVVGEPTAGADRAPFDAWVPTLLVLGIVVVACLAGALRTRGTPRALLLATVAAITYGLAAALVTGVVAVLDRHPVAVLGAWETWVLLLAAAGGTWAQQVGFSAGALEASLPVVTVGEPLVGALLGVVVLSERLDAGTGGRLVVGAVLVVCAVAVVALARSAARGAAPRDRTATGWSPVGTGGSGTAGP